jgi:seryl-tRNA synthetase
MMDIKFIRENLDLVKDNIKRKYQEHKLGLVDEALQLDVELRDLSSRAQMLRHRRNVLSEEINKLKKDKKDAAEQLGEARDIPEKIKTIEEKSIAIEEKLTNILRTIPNIMNSKVPSGKDSSENVAWEHHGKIRDFGFEVKSHVDLAEAFGGADFEMSAKTSGNGFYYLYGDLALLNQALLRFAIGKMVSKGFLYIETPLMLNGSVIKNVTDLNDMNNQIYKIQDEDLYLIGTSEHSLIGRFINSVIPDEKLPIKNTSYSMCFRKEIGSHGIDQKGLYRTHQFNKIEMVVICLPEESMNFFEEMKNTTVEIFTDLEIPIRVLGICSGDLGDLKHIQVDVEAWSPRKNEYFEVGSCSNLTECQARRLNIKYSDKQGNKNVAHTLNNTAIATSRALVAILENNQDKDGNVTIPKVLIPFMNGKEKIGVGNK